MKTSPEPPVLDCIAFKREAQSRIYDQIRALGVREEIEFFRRIVSEGSLADWWNVLVGETAGRPPGEPQAPGAPEVARNLRLGPAEGGT
ncbi:MAG: hypothetical protein HY814_08390 [Candidatus Riflebacteria bacterium]|nr:hypothetical protein [Candidatus Riflebacteria bacterium]